MTKSSPSHLGLRRRLCTSALAGLLGAAFLLGACAALTPDAHAAESVVEWYLRVKRTNAAQKRLMFLGTPSGVRDAEVVKGDGWLRLARNKTPIWDAGQGSRIESVERIEGGSTLVSDSAGRRVVMLAADGSVRWQVDAQAIPEIRHPVHAHALAADGPVLVTDGESKQVLLVRKAEGGGWAIEWSYSAADDAEFRGPTSARVLPSGNALITDTAQGRVLEVDSSKALVWSTDTQVTSAPRDAQRLSDGRTLVVDEAGNRVLILKKGSGQDVDWRYPLGDGTTTGEEQLKSPVAAEWLSDKSLLVADAGNGRIIRVSAEGYVERAPSDSAESQELAIDAGAGARDTGTGTVAVSSDRRRVFVYSYVGSGTFETEALDLIPYNDQAKYVTQVLSPQSRPKTADIKVSYRIDDGTWKTATPNVFEIEGDVRAEKMTFRVEMSTQDTRFSPELKDLKATFYLQKPSVLWKEKKKPPAQETPPPSTSPTQTPTTRPTNTNTQQGTGTGTGTGTAGSGAGAGSSGGSGSGSSAPSVSSMEGAPIATVATNVTAEQAEALLSGWVMDETGGVIGSKQSRIGDDGISVNLEGLVAALTMIAMAYSSGLSSPKLAAFALLATRPVREMVTRSTDG